MSDPSPESEPYRFQYSDTGRASRNELPAEIKMALFEILDALVIDPNGFPGRTRAISRDGSIRVYTHPLPTVQVTYEVDVPNRLVLFVHFVAVKIPVTKPVFISYSHKDAKWLEKLRMYLKPLEDMELIRVWDDREIRVGSEWFSEIQNALRSARVAVFLVTQDFLNSAFIGEKELPNLLQQATDRGCLIFWIAVSSSTFEDSPLARIQAANATGRPLDLLPEPEQNEVLKEIYMKMKRAVAVK